jgi:hypothetical protein
MQTLQSTEREYSSKENKELEEKNEQIVERLRK